MQKANGAETGSFHSGVSAAVRAALAFRPPMLKPFVVHSTHTPKPAKVNLPVVFCGHFSWGG